MAVDSFRKLKEVSQFSDALSALSTGEKIKDSALREKAEALKGDFEKLKSLGFKFDPEKLSWDLSGVKSSIPVSGNNKEIKQALANLISPDFSEKLFDPKRRESLSLGGSVIRPPHQEGGEQAVTIVKQADQDRDIQHALKRFGEEKASFLKASKESNTYYNAMTGRLWEMMGYERGNGGKTAPEIERDGALKTMLGQLDILKEINDVQIKYPNPCP